MSNVYAFKGAKFANYKDVKIEIDSIFVVSDKTRLITKVGYSIVDSGNKIYRTSTIREFEKTINKMKMFKAKDLKNLAEGAFNESSSVRG